jgi:hypothetical protein
MIAAARKLRDAAIPIFVRDDNPEPSTVAKLLLHPQSGSEWIATCITFTFKPFSRVSMQDFAAAFRAPANI